MESCSCPIVSREEIKALFDSQNAEEKEQAIACLVDLLTSRDERVRARGYELFAEGIKDALLCSCFNYSSLVGGFTHPLLEALTRSLEMWAAAAGTAESKSALSLKSLQS